MYSFMLRTCLGIIVAGLCSMFQLAGQSTFQKHYGGPGDDYGADVVAVEDGYVALPDAPGIGFELKQPLYSVMRDLAS